MAITQAQLSALNTTIKARFAQGLSNKKQDWMKIAKLITSDGKSNTYAWLSAFPAFREWVGNRLHKVAKETAFTVANRKFENTLDIPMEDIEDDNYGMYGDVAQSYGESVFDLQNDLVFSAVAIILNRIAIYYFLHALNLNVICVFLTLQLII